MKEHLTEGSPSFFHLPHKQSICWHLFDHLDSSLLKIQGFRCYLCFPGFKEPDRLFLPALNSTKDTSWEFRTQWGWGIASGLDNEWRKNQLTAGTTLMAPCPDSLRSSCMIGLNLVIGLQCWSMTSGHLVSSTRCLASSI